MTPLDHALTITEALMKSPNLTGRFTEKDLDTLGKWVWDGYLQDKNSRFQWEKRTEAAMDLALQLQKSKAFPWPGASNVAFPLVTIATLQFHSRAYPALVQGPDLVKYRVVGPDPKGEEKARALRIGAHMSYQVLEEDTSWEEQHDRLLINVPIVGCAFKKTYHNSSKERNQSDLVLARDLVMDYYAKSTEDCARKTHVVPLYRNEMHERMVLGTFHDYTGEAWYQGDAIPLTDAGTARVDTRDGVAIPQSDFTTPFTTLEQHCWFDFDKDGYAEPYIITIEATTKKVLRIVARWEREEDILRTTAGRTYSITSTEYFTKYPFIPSPDNSIYDTGFGILLGPLNESVNTLVNQLIDAGTMSNSAGGFLGRGAKIRGGAYTFAPLEWKRVDSTGDDLKKSIFPLPVREPSAVLFQLLGLLVNYTERISGSTDIMVGENIGQNTPKGTADQLVEQGSKIYSALFKRIWRAEKEEFKKLFVLNQVYMPTMVQFGAEGQMALRDDYMINPTRLVPSADPNITSDSTRLQQAITIKQSAMVTPGYNPVEVEKNLLRAMHVDGVEVLYPGPEKTGPLPNVKLQVEEQKMKIAQMKLEQQKQEFLITMMEEQRMNSAKILELTSKAELEIAEAKGVEQGHKIAAFETMVGALKAHDDHLRGQIDLMLKDMERKSDEKQAGVNGGAGPGLAAKSGNASPAPSPSGVGAGA